MAVRDIVTLGYGFGARFIPVLGYMAYTITDVGDYRPTYIEHSSEYRPTAVEPTTEYRGAVPAASEYRPLSPVRR